MKKVSLCILVFFLGMVVSAQATTISLGSLFAGDDFYIGDKHFFGFELIGVNGDFAYNLISLETLEDQPLNPGVRFFANGELTAVGITDVGLDFSYYVETTSGRALIKDNSLDLTGYSFSGDAGYISIYEFVEDSSGEEIAIKNVFYDNLDGEFKLSDYAEFPVQNYLHITNSIRIIGELDDGEVILSSFEQRFSQVPEPTTMLLLGTGLLGVAGAARRKKKNQA